MLISRFEKTITNNINKDFKTDFNFDYLPSVPIYNSKHAIKFKCISENTTYKTFTDNINNSIFVFDMEFNHTISLYFNYTIDGVVYEYQKSFNVQLEVLNKNMVLGHEVGLMWLDYQRIASVIDTEIYKLAENYVKYHKGT